VDSLAKRNTSGLLRGLSIAIPLLILLALGVLWNQHRMLARDNIDAEQEAAMLEQENVRLRAQISELQQAIEQKRKDLAQSGQARDAAP